MEVSHRDKAYGQYSKPIQAYGTRACTPHPAIPTGLPRRITASRSV